MFPTTILPQTRIVSVKLFLALFLLLVISVPLCIAIPSAPYPPTAYFESDPAPEAITPIGNPLDWAGMKIGLDVRNFELPRAYENDYRFVCRFPIIDAVSNRPLYMKQWTEENAAEFIRLQPQTGPATARLATGWLIGGHDKNPDYTWDKDILADFTKALRKSPYSTAYQQALANLYQAWLAASLLVEEGLSTLTEEDQSYFKDNPVAFLLPDDNTIAPLTGNTDTHLEYINHLRQARLDHLILAGEIITTAITEYQWQVHDLGEAGCLTDLNNKNESFSFESKYGTLNIKGRGDDSHTADAAILIDLGGKDTYTNNSGGADRSVAICIDHSGDDFYDAKDRRYVQGCGLFGVGILADLAGNDHYTAKHFAQGAGIAGIGVLYDPSGDDIYSGHGFTQGAAMFGLGMLMDNGGDDSYDCATLSQGGATTMGLGILADLAGNDKYKLGTDTGKNAFDGLPGYGQGGALSFRHNPWRGRFTPYGGVGFLIDGNGNDDYVTTGWCDQGGSYIMSLGALYDGGGNDHYKANTGQGSGIHITNAILIDKDGDDHYEGAFRTGGSGGDRTPGFLIDYAGNDTYQSGSSSYGTGVKPFSYSLMIDYKGDDNYITANPVGPILFNCWDSFGGVWPESAPNLFPYAICLDLGGKDNYQVRNRANNTIRHSFGHGLQVDMEWDGGDVVGGVESPLQKYPLEGTKLASPNMFIRFNQIGLISNDSTADLKSLFFQLRYSTNRQLNRDALECLHYYLIEKRLPETPEASVASLLTAKDPEVRTIIADDIGVFGLESCDAALVKALDDDEDSVRRFAYRSLITFKSIKGLGKARVAVKKDKSEDVRRLALAYLMTVEEKDKLYKVLAERLEKDDASAVKVAAADALGRLGNRDGVKALRKATKSYDVYVQRAAAKALCELGEVEGIGVLIESLTFPSIDAFYNYDYNVPNFIATYAGYDLPEPDRFEQSKWRDWFIANREKIDLKENVAASKAFVALGDSLRGASDEKQIELLEGFLKAHPGNRNASGALAANLNRIAWDMATAPKDNLRYNPALAVRYSLRAVELIPDPNYWDTVAEAYFAAGKYDESAKVCNDQLAKSPGNRMFLDRLDKIGKR